MVLGREGGKVGVVERALRTVADMADPQERLTVMGQALRNQQARASVPCEGVGVEEQTITKQTRNE